MTERFNTFRPDGEATADRWAGALHLFDRTDQAGRADPTEETPADRWERAGLMFEERRYIEAARLLAGLVEEFPVTPRPGSCSLVRTTTRLS